MCFELRLQFLNFRAGNRSTQTKFAAGDKLLANEPALFPSGMVFADVRADVADSRVRPQSRLQLPAAGRGDVSRSDKQRRVVRKSHLFQFKKR